MPFPVIPVAIGGGVLGLTAIGLRLRAMAVKAKAKTTATIPFQQAPPTPPVILPSGRPVAAPPITPVTTIAQASAAAQGKPIPPPTPNAPTMADLAATLADPTFAARNGISFDSVTDEQLNAAADLMNAQNKAKVSETTGAKGIVTTNDPPPSGDLRVFSGPSTSNQIGGAEKGGLVTILDATDPVFAKINWAGGSRWPAVEGFAKKAFIKLL